MGLSLHKAWSARRRSCLFLLSRPAQSPRSLSRNQCRHCQRYRRQPAQEGSRPQQLALRLTTLAALGAARRHKYRSMCVVKLTEVDSLLFVHNVLALRSEE